MNAFLASIQKTIKNTKSVSPLLVHADVFRARSAILNTSNPRLMLERHLDALQTIAGERPLFLPVFNYDYTRSRVYRPGNEPSQVGVLNEYVRSHMVGARCGGPIFNFYTNAPALAADLPCCGLVDPFNADTVFGLVDRAQGQVLMYGAPFASFTAVHYIERLSGERAGCQGGPLYRYDKVFPGTVQFPDGSSKTVELNYHCRPMGKTLEYDWPRLRQEAEAQGVLRSVNVPGSEVMVLDMASITQFWLAHLRRDPLYLLDSASRSWVEPMLDQIGRRFLINDFECAL